MAPSRYRAYISYSHKDENGQSGCTPASKHTVFKNSWLGQRFPIASYPDADTM